MWGLAGYQPTKASSMPKVVGNMRYSDRPAPRKKGVAGPDTHRINAGGGKQELPRSATRQSLTKQRAQLARINREDDHG